MITVDFVQLGINDGDLILDAGCGVGRHSWDLVKSNHRVFSIDLDAEALATNYKFLKYLDALGEIRGTYCILQSNVQALPFADATFDRVICSEVLEHVDDYFEATAELVRVLKPGGTIGVSVPTWITEVFYWKLDKNYSHPGGHIRIFRAYQVRELLEAFGLTILGSNRRHSLHSPYWFLRCLFGLDRENALLTRAYNRFLCWVENHSSPPFKFLERLLDPLFGKSLVYYALKAEDRAMDAAGARAAVEHRRKKENSGRKG
ncbi:MAG TPA: class I SAM-dependent methyltransferase [Candidatus Limnocylindrales bacterium]|nr:class I SAM-dependent methyltransferase [Candidatus Limnocylindrales bacterium]